MKKLLTLADLYDFYFKENKDLTFDSKTMNSSVIVHYDESFKFEENKNEFYSYGQFKLCHTEKNRNGTNISEEAMTNAIPSAYNMPVLAYIYYNEKTEQKEFMGHEFYVDEDTNELIYEEAPVGVIPESADLKLEYDEENEKTYLVGSGLLWKNYSSASEIIERMNGKCKVSVEIAIDKFSYDAKEKVLNIEEFHFLGATFLGKDEDGKDIGEGMEGSKFTLSDFSLEANSITNLKKGGKAVEFEDNLLDPGNDVDPTVEDPAGDGTNPAGDNTEPTGDNTNPTGDNTNPTGDNTDPAGDNTDPTDDDPTGDDTEPTGSNEPINDEAPIKKDGIIEYSVNRNGVIKTYSLTIGEQLSALDELIDVTYGIPENTFYCVDADTATNTVFMHDYWNNKHYKQQYTLDNEIFTLVGERVELFVKYLTQEEVDQLEEMKTNYSLMETKLQEYEMKKDKYNKYSFMQTSKKKPGKYGTIFDK